MSKANILIVDDHSANLRLLQQILTMDGYTVRSELNGQLAIAAVQAELPDLILLDVLMPEMSGYEVCRRLKADERTRDIPIIFLTAKNDVADKVQAFSLDAADYIVKPFQIEEILARLTSSSPSRTRIPGSR